MKIAHVFVVGGGAMGRGIAQVCAQAGCTVKMLDINDSLLTAAMEAVTHNLKKAEKKNTLQEPKEKILARIETTTVIDDANDAELVIEAINEDLELKQDVFRTLEKVCPSGTVFGTNTSSIPVTEIAASIKSQGRVVGIHFFNPVHRMQLVEIVKGLMTSDKTVRIAKDFAISIGKEPVIVNRDSAGFIVNRINGMAFLEALRLLEKGIGTVEDIDKAMRLGLGHPMGPFELMDMIGLDIVLNARMSIYNETREPNHFPPDILRRMVKTGNLGRKTKKGFYDYSK